MTGSDGGGQDGVSQERSERRAGTVGSGGIRAGPGGTGGLGGLSGACVPPAGDGADPQGHGHHRVRAARHQPDAGVRLQ